MHLYFITRGLKFEVDRFITHLQGKMLPMKFRKPDEKELQDVVFEMGVRPIQLWELVFPEEHLETMSRSLFTSHKKEKPQHKWQEKFVFVLRKILKLSKIPGFENNPTLPHIPLPGIEHVEVVGIGIKKDYYVTLSGSHVAERTEGCYEGL